MDASVLMEKLRGITSDWRSGFGQCIDGRFVKESVWIPYYNNRLPNVPMIIGVCWGETKGNVRLAEILLMKISCSGRSSSERRKRSLSGLPALPMTRMPGGADRDGRQGICF